MVAAAAIALIAGAWLLGPGLASSATPDVVASVVPTTPAVTAPLCVIDAESCTSETYHSATAGPPLLPNCGLTYILGGPAPTG